LFENKRFRHWTEGYWNQIKRNIGLISLSEQEKLKITPIAVLGLGGLGGPLAEQLIRSGFENLIISDNDKFDESNLNRQLCNRDDIGKLKVDYTESYLKRINPEIKIKKYYQIDENNISNIIKSVKLIILTLDDPIISILISRECLKEKIPLLESWAIPYLCAWWFTDESIDYETCYGLKTHNLEIQELKKSKDIKSKIKRAQFDKLTQFPNIIDRYDREKGALEGMLSGSLPSISFAPIVRISASYLAFEAIYSGILKVKPKILAPNIIGYDYLRMVPIKFSFI
jgi:hypothetical protein